MPLLLLLPWLTVLLLSVAVLLVAVVGRGYVVVVL